MTELMRRTMLALLIPALLAVPWTAGGQDSNTDRATIENPRAQEKLQGDGCMVGPGLAATLLVPYFEAELDGSLNTLVAVANGTGGNTLCRVVLWTDWGIPSLAFDIYLSAFDIETFTLRDLFNGVIPSTGDGADLSGFPYCGSLVPFHDNPALGSEARQRLFAMHTGGMDSTTKNCAGEDYGDGLVRGYITIDVVDECSGVESVEPVFTPANTTYPYFAEGGGSGGIAIAGNWLWGDVIYVDSDNNYAQASEVVAIWADPAKFNSTNIYTFYGRYSGWDGRDERVPLPSMWDQRFFNGGPFAGAASLIVWRDTGSANVTPASCDTGPSWRPLEADLTALDEDGNILSFPANTSIPVAAMRVNINNLAIPEPFGWIQVRTTAQQSWVQPSLAAFGRFSASFNGAAISFLCAETPQ